MENVTYTEKEQALIDFENRQKKRLVVGKTIVMFIALLNVILAVMSAIANFNLLTLVIQITLSIALFLGVIWVRYLFAIGAALGFAINLYLLVNIVNEPTVWIILFLVLNIVFNIASCILLFANKYVSDFLYSQKNG